MVLPHLPCYKMLTLLTLFGDPPLERIGMHNFSPMLELSTPYAEELKKGLFRTSHAHLLC